MEVCCIYTNKRGRGMNYNIFREETEKFTMFGGDK